MILSHIGDTGRAYDCCLTDIINSWFISQRGRSCLGCWLDLSTHDSLSTCKWMSACFCYSAFICYKLDLCGPSLNHGDTGTREENILLFDWYYQPMIQFPERVQLSRGCWLDLSTHDSLSTCKWMSACFCHSAFICHKLDICGPSDHSTLVNVGPEDSQGPYSQNTRCFPLQKRKKSERTQRHVPSTVLLDVKIDSLCPLSQLEPTSFYL